MEGEDSESEVFIVAIAVGSVLEQFDLVVGTFQRAGRDGVVVPGEQAGSMLAQGVATACRARMPEASA